MPRLDRRTRAVLAAAGPPLVPRSRGITQVSERILINEPYILRSRTNKAGKTTDRVSIEVVSQPILHEFDELRMGKGPSEAIRDVLSQAIQNIDKNASDSTIAFRIIAEDAFNRSPQPAWVRRRYGGGRTKPRPPGQSQRLFNDSGRLAHGLFVRENVKEKSYTVNVPANRLNRESFTAAEFERMLRLLSSLVPELRNPALIGRKPEVRAAVSRSIDQLIRRATDLNRQKRAELRRELARTFGFGNLAQLL